MRPGIIIQHARERAPESTLVRSDVVGFIGVVPRARWPKNAVLGDFFEMPLVGYPELAQNPARHVFDPVTRRAVRSFFENGGVKCILFGLCVDSESDLMTQDPFATVFFSLIDRLRSEEDLAVLAMPVLAYLPTSTTPRGYPVVHCEPVLQLLLEHCAEMNHRFLIIDAPRDLHDITLHRWVERFRQLNSRVSSYGAVYYPWLMAGDETMPPSGCVAGIFARVDRGHQPFGVRWPPANETIRGVTHPAIELRWSEIDTYLDFGVNPIVTQPAKGVVIWGARTLSRDPRWLHINSRRIVSYVSEQLKRDSEWVVFENNRPELWEVVTRMVTSRLEELASAGLLNGDRAGSDYLVQCDKQLNPPEARNAGIVNVRVVLSPISTTEQIVVELRLGAGGSAVGSV